MKKNEWCKSALSTKGLKTVGLQQFPALLYACDINKAMAR